MRLCFLVVMYCTLVSCTTETIRMYNLEDLQDKDCYTRYGARPGYCDKSRD